MLITFSKESKTKNKIGKHIVINPPRLPSIINILFDWCSPFWILDYKKHIQYIYLCPRLFWINSPWQTFLKEIQIKGWAKKNSINVWSTLARPSSHLELKVRPFFDCPANVDFKNFLTFNPSLNIIRNKA